jgi:hypothetical protein
MTLFCETDFRGLASPRVRDRSCLHRWQGARQPRENGLRLRRPHFLAALWAVPLIDLPANQSQAGWGSPLGDGVFDC